MSNKSFSVFGVLSKALLILFFVLVLPLVVLLIFPQPTANVMVIYFGLALLFAAVLFFGSILRVLLFTQKEREAYAADVFKLGTIQQRTFSDFELTEGESILVAPTPAYISGRYHYVAVTNKRATIGFVRGRERRYSTTREILGKMNLWRKDAQISESLHKEDFTDKFPFTLPTHWITDWNSRIISTQASKDDMGEFVEVRFTKGNSESTLRLYTPQAAKIAKILS